jgi:hypothetical protein
MRNALSGTADMPPAQTNDVSATPAIRGGPRRTAALRAGEAQAADVAVIAAFLQNRAAVPGWLVGTSRGSTPSNEAAM